MTACVAIPLKAEIHELKKELMFAKKTIEKLSKKAPISIDADEIENRWWKDHEIKIKDAFSHKFEPEYKNLYIVALRDYPGISWTEPKDVKNFVTLTRCEL